MSNSSLAAQWAVRLRLVEPGSCTWSSTPCLPITIWSYRCINLESARRAQPLELRAAPGVFLATAEGRLRLLPSPLPLKLSLFAVKNHFLPCLIKFSIAKPFPAKLWAHAGINPRSRLTLPLNAIAPARCHCLHPLFWPKCPRLHRIASAKAH